MPSSMIDLAILGLLTEQELHGYELKKRLGELLTSRASVSNAPSSPTVRRHSMRRTSYSQPALE